MEVVCSQSATLVPVVNYSSSGSRQLSLFSATSLECSLGGGLGRQPLTCKPRTSSSKRVNRIPRGGQFWSLGFRSEATAGFEDSIPDKRTADVVVRKSRDMIATGGHRGSLNAYSAIEDVDSGEKVKEEVGKEVCHGLNGDATCALVKTLNGVSRNGSANGNSLKRAARNGSVNEHSYNGIPPLNGSANVASANGDLMYADMENVLNLHSSDGIYRNLRAVNGASMNGAVNGYSKAPTADGASSMVPELEKPDQAPLNVPLKQSESVDTLMDLLRQLEDPMAFTTTLAPLRPQRAGAGTDKVELRDAGWQQSSDADSGGGLGIIKFLKGKNLLVTGATGFLAKGTHNLTESLFFSIKDFNAIMSIIK